jgi:hypothetical protein
MAVSSISLRGEPMRSGKYCNRATAPDLIPKEIASGFDRRIHEHGTVLALTNDRLKPLMAKELSGKTMLASRSESEYISSAKALVACRLVRSLSSEQLALNRQGGVALNKLNSDQLDKARFLALYGVRASAIIDPFDTRPGDSLENAKIYVCVAPILRFRGTYKGRPLLSWYMYHDASVKIEKEMEKRRKPEPGQVVPDERFKTEVTIAADEIPSEELLKQLGAETGIPLAVDPRFAALKLHAYCKAKTIDILCALADVTGLGWDIEGDGWILTADDWAVKSAKWRLENLWSNVSTSYEKAAKQYESVMRSLVLAQALPLWADKEWLADKRLYSLILDNQEVTYDKFTDEERTWITRIVDMRAEMTEEDRDALRLAARGCKYFLEPRVQFRLLNDHVTIFQNDWPITELRRSGHE